MVFGRKLRICIAALSPFVAWSNVAAFDNGRTVVNIVNFVRGCEPRQEMDLVRPLAEEIKLNTRYGFPNTILLQYDAMLRDDMLAVAKSADRKLTEYGVWIEMVRQLVERVGLKWRGRPGWDWDWHITPSALVAYTHEERMLLIDELFRLFKEKFGGYPVSVGSWVLDAWSIEYMKGKYDIHAVCICREQDNTDAYGLRGGYSNGAYYPSRKNVLSAATDMANAVRVPVFRMLTPDPIYNYGWDYHYIDLKTGERRFHCPTMEPAWFGRYERTIDWYFRMYTEPRWRLNLAYMQIGQENSFGWETWGVNLGYPRQMEAIKRYSEKGLLEVRTLGDTGRAFQGKYRSNCPQTCVALEDWSGNGRRSAWYNCRNYRANVYFEKGKLYIRDIHKMCDAFPEPHLNSPNRDWQELLYTPPVIDGYLFATNGVSGMMKCDGDWLGFDVKSEGEGVMVVKAWKPDLSEATIRFDEKGIVFDGVDGLTVEMNDRWRNAHKFGERSIELAFSGFSYRVGYVARLQETSNGYILKPICGVLSLNFSL